MSQAVVATHIEAQQQHPIKLYLVVWGWLFVLSTCSYLVDYFGLVGYLPDRRGLHAHGLGAVGVALRDPRPADAGIGLRRDHGLRIKLYALQSARLLRGKAIMT
jgi:hypothetical protein